MNTLNLSIGQKVAKENTSNEYYTGTVQDVRGNKALIHFDTRGFSRWCNSANLEVLN